MGGIYALSILVSRRPYRFCCRAVTGATAGFACGVGHQALSETRAAAPGRSPLASASDVAGGDDDAEVQRDVL
jgi:hypothetical protein